MGDGRKKIFISFKTKDFTTFNKACLTFITQIFINKRDWTQFSVSQGKEG